MQKHLLALLGLGTALVSCGSPVSSSKVTDVPTYNPNQNLASGVDNTSFRVTLTSDQANIILHKASTAYGVDADTSNFSAACTVAPNATLLSDQDILCIGEVGELDAYASSMNLHLNVPQSMCKYVKFNPYHFWAYRPGVGPTVVQSWTMSSGSVVDGNYTVNGIAKPCPFDYTLAGGPNCCEGKYVRRTYMETGGSWTFNDVESDWGGSAAACLAGPATLTQKKTGQGYPIPNAWFVETTGLSQDYSIAPPIEQSMANLPVAGNEWTSNFYQPSEHTPASLGSAPAVETPPAGAPVSTYTPPNPLDTGTSTHTFNVPVALRQAAGIPYVPSDTYELTCYDAAQEVKSRIRLMIREWNKEALVENCIAGVNCPDDGGTEPSYPDQDINDHTDWLDVGNDYPGNAGKL